MNSEVPSTLTGTPVISNPSMRNTSTLLRVEFLLNETLVYYVCSRNWSPTF